MPRGHTVRVVLDADFGERLAELPRSDPVWIMDTPTNTPVAQRLWKQPHPDSRHAGITIFKGYGPTEQEIFLNELGTIDLHHGGHSVSPPYSTLEVIGCTASEDIRAALDEIGFEVESPSQSGFTAIRKHEN
jgi:hypothetical protein